MPLAPIAREICRRYRLEFPDERERYGRAGEAWCLHDNHYLVAWAVEDLRLDGQLRTNVAWLARVLAARSFPLERLARDLELAAEVVAEHVPDRAGDLSERLVAAARSVLDADAEAPADEPVTWSLQKAYVAALLAGRPRIAREAVEHAIDEGLPVKDAYLQVIQPALYEIGELWESGRATVAQEHLATATTDLLLARLASKLDRLPRSGRTAVVAGTAGELHALGTRFVSDFLDADGWSVVELGASMPARDLATFVREHEPDVVALSTTMTTNLGAAEASVAALKELPHAPLVVVGGRAYGGDEALASRVGADLFAPDPGTLSSLLQDRLDGR